MCMICRDDTKETRYIDLYVIGSEGLNVCHECEMKIVEFVRQMIHNYSQERIKKVIAAKKLSDWHMLE